MQLDYVYTAKRTNMITCQFLQDKLGLIFLTTVNVYNVALFIENSVHNLATVTLPIYVVCL